VTVPADWQDFAQMIGGASGALTGLLFVAVSLNASQIGEHEGLRASAAQTLVLFITPLTMAAALLTPRQPSWVAGTELMAIGVIASWILLTLKRGLADDELRLLSLFDRRAPNVLVMLLFVASGVALICGANVGLYLLLPAALVAFISGVLNAWSFLLPPPQGQGPHRPGQPRRS
jgi:hypothetical protein